MGEWWDVPRQDRRTNDRDFWIELTRDRYRTQAGRSASSNGSDRGRVGTVGRLSARARATGRPDPGLPIPSRGRKPDRPSAVGGGRETGPAKPLDPPSRPERGARPRGGPQEDPAGDAPSAGPRLQHLPARRPLHRPDAGRRDPVPRRTVRPERPRQRLGVPGVRAEDAAGRRLVHAPGRLRPRGGHLRGVRAEEDPDRSGADRVPPAPRGAEAPPEGRVPDRARPPEEAVARVDRGPAGRVDTRGHIGRSGRELDRRMGRRKTRRDDANGTFLSQHLAIPSLRVEGLGFIRPRFLAVAFFGFFASVAYLAYS